MSSHVLVYCACITLVHCPQNRSFELAIYIFFNTNRGQMYRSLEGQSINCSLSPCYEASETKLPPVFTVPALNLSLLVTEFEECFYFTLI